MHVSLPREEALALFFARTRTTAFCPTRCRQARTVQLFESWPGGVVEVRSAPSPAKVDFGLNDDECLF